MDSFAMAEYLATVCGAMLMKRLLAGVLGIVIIPLPASDVEAQVDVGAHVAVADDMDLGIGLNLGIPLSSFHEHLEFNGAFTFFFPDNLDYWEIDADVRYFFPLEENPSVLPYAMAGLAIGNISWDLDGPGDGVDDSNTEPGLRLGGGVQFPTERLNPFIDLALSIGDVPDFTLRGGLSVPFGNSSAR